MEDTNKIPEPRSRSRSKTPFLLRSHCDKDNCTEGDHLHHGPTKKIPSVQKITEEAELEISAVSSSSPPATSTNNNNKRTTIVTKELASASSSQQQQQQLITETITTTVTKSASSQDSIITGGGIRASTPLQQQQQRLKTTVPQTSSIIRTKRQNNGGNTASSSTISSSSKEINQNEINQKFEEIRHSTPVLKSGSRLVTSKTTTTINNTSSGNSSNGSNKSSPIILSDDPNEHAPFREYRDAGEYWNKFPKTDYTYSELSPHRREVVPGQIAMPNMSRRSLDLHHNRVDFMTQQSPEQESFIRARYLSAWDNAAKIQQKENLKTTKSAAATASSTATTTTKRITTTLLTNQWNRENNYYDSQDELDVGGGGGDDIGGKINDYRYTRRAINDNYYNQYGELKQSSIISRFFSTIASWFYSIITCFSSSSSNNNNNYNFNGRYSSYQQYNQHGYYTQLKEEKGWLRKIFSFLASPFVTIFRYIYLFISSVLLLDTWLLRSSHSSESETGKKKKGFLLFLLLLLPLLLFTAWHQQEDHERRAIILKIQQSVPLGLPPILATLSSKSSTIVKYFQNVSGNFGNIFNFNFNWIPSLLPLFRSNIPSITTSSSPSSSSSYSSHHTTTTTTTNNNQNTILTDEQYTALLNHINSYINQLNSNNEQQSEQKITKNLSLQIGQIVKENIINYNYQLNDMDIEKIAEIVREKIVTTEKPFTFSQNNLEEISKIVKEIPLTTSSTSNEIPIDIDEIIFKILNSPKLMELVDQRVMDKTNIEKKLLLKQTDAIKKLKDEIELIKLQIAQQQQQQASTVKVNDENIKLSVLNLHKQYDEIKKEFYTSKQEYNNKLQDLLLEIDGKIAGFNDSQFKSINEHVRITLMEIIGYKKQINGENVIDNDLNNVDIEKWMHNIFVAKEYLEKRLLQFNVDMDEKFKDEIDRTAGVLMVNISEQIKRETIIQLEKNKDDELLKIEEKKQKDGSLLLSSSSSSSLVGVGLSNLQEDAVKRIVNEALSVYDADKTGMVDYALESAGGEIISTRCTETFHSKSAQISIFGIPLWYPTNTPRTAISPTVQPGQCWAFQGFPGFLVLKLNTYIIVTGFTIEHIPKSLAPNGRIDSAPKLFTVWGLETENDHEPVQFGEYEYKENGTSLQYFRVENTETLETTFHIVELRIESNHGNQNYTCLYRFRVHGKPQK